MNKQQITEITEIAILISLLVLLAIITIGASNCNYLVYQMNVSFTNNCYWWERVAALL